MKSVISVLVCYLLIYQASAMDNSFTYPFISSVSKPVNFSREDIENIPFLKEKFFGHEGIHAVDQEGNFYWRGVTREQLLDIRSLARKGENLIIRNLKTEPRNLIKLADLVEAWGLKNLKPQLIDLFHYCLEMDIKISSEAPRLTLNAISESFIRDQLFILTHQKMITLDNLSTIIGLKKAIEKRFGVPIDQQILLFCGRQLEEGGFLKDYKVCKESTFLLYRRIRGD